MAPDRPVLGSQRLLPRGTDKYCGSPSFPGRSKSTRSLSRRYLALPPTRTSQVIGPVNMTSVSVNSTKSSSMPRVGMSTRKNWDTRLAASWESSAMRSAQSIHRG
eukprot:scaffold2314_cov267-Pinguiococcus_pyrenoidosus.AAC.10